MAALGIILSAVDGLVIATDTFPGASGGANDSIRQLDPNTGCFVYSANADRVLQAYLGGGGPLPARPEDFTQALEVALQSFARYLRRRPLPCPAGVVRGNPAKGTDLVGTATAALPDTVEVRHQQIELPPDAGRRP